MRERENDLLDLHGGAGALELRLDLGGLLLGDGLLDRLGRTLDEVQAGRKQEMDDLADLLAQFG